LHNIAPIRSKVRLQVLDSQQLKDIRSATLHVLEQVGVRFPSEKALKVFAKHGAQVDMESQLVRIPSDLVLEAMKTAPRSYLLAGRAQGTDLLLDGTSSYFGTDGCGTMTVDFETREGRQSTKEDVAKMARVVDYLPGLWALGTPARTGSQLQQHR
jgi:trimethylamine--corrinoid protein Co-methyltransferase